MPPHPASDNWNVLSAACGNRRTGHWRDRVRTAAPGLRNWAQRRLALISSADAAGEDATLTRRDPKMARLEAVLLVADGALSTRKLAQLATLIDAAEAGRLIDALNAAYDAVDSAFRVERVAAGYQLLTRPRFARWLDKLHHRSSQLKLSPPALETLTIVAYRQPVTRADVEEIRGVGCAEILKQLMERNLVRIAGNDESLGRPYLYGTTRTFLELFGLRNLNDLPTAERLRREKPRETSNETEAEAAAEREAQAATDDASAPALDEDRIEDAA